MPPLSAQRMSDGVPLNSPKELWKNFATDTGMAARAKKYVLPMLERARRNRVKSDERAMRRYNQWALVKDESSYRGRANVKIPAVRKGVESLVTGALRATFPTNRWWSVEAEAKEFEPNVDGIRTLMGTQLKRRMRVKRKARPLYRQLFLYGVSPARLQWKTETHTEVALVMGEDGPRMVRRTTTDYDDPDFTVVDYFGWGVYPETVPDIDDAKLVYEDEVVDAGDLEADKANYANLKEARSSAGSGAPGGQALIKRQQRLQRLGITETELNDKDFLFLTHCCIRFDFKDGFGPVPAIVTLAWESTVVRLQRNKYGRPPYLCMKDLEVPTEFLAHARTEATENLSVVLDDTANQDQDAVTFANNPVLIADPAVVDDLYSIAVYPGAKIPASPDAVKFDRPPDAAYGGKEKIAFLHGLILDSLGSVVSQSASPGAKTQTRGARTFGGMQMMQGLASLEIKEVVEFNEELFWVPLLERTAWLNAHFLSDERTLQTAGMKGAAIVVHRDTFKGDYAYDWLGSTTTQNQTVLSSQLLVAMNIARGFPPNPSWQINVPHMFRTWWDWAGLPDADRIVLEAGRQQPIDPEIENQLVRVGRAVEVAAADNDAQHIVSHMLAGTAYEPGDPKLEALRVHQMEHEQQQQAKMLAQQMAMQRAVMGGGANGGPPPSGARAGMAPGLTPPSGTGPAMAMAGAPGGMA